MKVVFLDFDGVCTSLEETPGSYLNHSACDYGPSPHCVQKVIELCKKSGAKIVISSNWRKFDPDGKWAFKDEEVTNPLPKLVQMLGNYCIGALEPIQHKTKAFALVKWLDMNDVESFVVLDDDPREGFQSEQAYSINEKTVYTDCKTGFSDNDLKKAYTILTERH